jgi:hypothetical protein
MAKYKLKKGQNIGGLAAETDPLLEKVFVDTGYLQQIKDTNNPKFLILGRTGSGKTALIKFLSDEKEKIKYIDLDVLSMQYLHNNPIINILSEWGIHFDIFYKYLWKHIFILELIKLRYEGKDGTSFIKKKIENILYASNKNTRDDALDYLNKFGDEFWILSDTHVKGFTQELETNLKKDANIKVGIDNLLDVNFGLEKNKKTNVKIENDIVVRAQSIINNYLISNLDAILESMIKNSFNDPQKRYYLIIDDLDKNWMPDDSIYLDLIHCLITVVKELNSKLKFVKIVVALRTNIFYRIIEKINARSPQIEKWYDVLIDIKWNKEEIEDLINKRLYEVYKETYTNISPTLNSILPRPKQKKSIDAFEYMLERTFYRPRDILDWFNKIIEKEGNLDINWTKLENAEIEYSKSRLASVIDEWKLSFYGIELFFPLLKKLNGKFQAIDIENDDIMEIIFNNYDNKYDWIIKLSNSIETENDIHESKFKIINTLYIMGLIGIKNKLDHIIIYSFDQNIINKDITLENMNNYIYCVHPMFNKALTINT